MGLDLLGLPDQQRAQFGVVTERLQRPGNIHARRVIAAHHIDGDSCHGPTREGLARFAPVRA
jgi:urocanate hydratase